LDEGDKGVAASVVVGHGKAFVRESGGPGGAEAREVTEDSVDGFFGGVEGGGARGHVEAGGEEGLGVEGGKLGGGGGAGRIGKGGGVRGARGPSFGQVAVADGIEEAGPDLILSFYESSPAPRPELKI
jgi:hypothetical protein